MGGVRASVMIAIAAPFVLTLCLAPAPYGWTPRWGLKVYGCLVSAPGVAGIILAPCTMKTRLLILLACVPLVFASMLAPRLAASCALFRDRL